MKQFATLSLCVVMAFFAATVNAKEKKGKAPAKDLSLTGTISQVEENKKAPFAITLDDGTKVAIPARATKKANIDLSAHVDKKVTLTCKGIEMKKGEKTIIKIRVITAIEGADDAVGGGEEEPETGGDPAEEEM